MGALREKEARHIDLLIIITNNNLPWRLPTSAYTIHILLVHSFNPIGARAMNVAERILAFDARGDGAQRCFPMGLTPT